MAQTTIIIPTVGTRHLARCVRSAIGQSVSCEVLVVVDGPKCEEAVRSQLPEAKNLHVAVLPWNVGGGNPKLLGHPMYGAFPMLCKTKYVAFLDEDNWYDTDHVESLQQTCEKYELDWAFSLRKIWSGGEFRCVDNCESLGNIRNAYDREQSFLVDTSCYLIKAEVARELAHVWYHPHADRPVTKFLMERFPKFRSNYKATLNYDFKEDNVRNQKVHYFDLGNAITGYDFVNLPVVYLAHKNAKETDALLRSPDWKLYGLTRHTVNMLDAFKFCDTMPTGSKLLVTLCDRSGMDVKMLKRHDLDKILVLPDPPLPSNVLNWDIGFLYLFHKIYSCWKPMEKVIDRAEFFPTNSLMEEPCRAFKVDTNRDKTNVCVCVPHPLPDDVQGGKKVYVVNNVRVQCGDVKSQLEAARNHFGNSIDAFVHPESPMLDWIRKETQWKVVSTDPNALNKYRGCFIPLYTDAEGSLPREFYDCLLAGTVPILARGGQKASISIEDSTIDIAKFSSERLELLAGALESSLAKKILHS